MLIIQQLISILLAAIVSSSLCTAEKIEKNVNLKGNIKSKTKSDTLKVHLLPTEVAVIGAGISGLSAARKISRDRSNFTVTVYEARMERFGGRVWTDKLRNNRAKGVEVDLGASALNIVSKNNPLLELAEDFELKTAALEGLAFFVPWEGKVYTGTDISQITKDASQILSQALNESRTSKLEQSVREAVDHVIMKGDLSLADSLGAQLVKCLPSYIIKDYSTRNYKPDALDVGYEKVLLDGIGEIVDRLVSGFGDEPPLHLQLNHVVRQIKVDESKKKVTVRFKDGSQIDANKVVIAVPASIITSQDLLFEPELPKNYKLSLSEMGTATSNKLILEFDHAFWPDDVGIFLKAVNKDRERGWMQSWINLQRVAGLPMLATFITGDRAMDFEKLSDEEIEESAISILIEMFGDEVVRTGGKLNRIQRSQWVTDEFSKGSHTYPKVGSSPSMWNTLSEPLCPYVYFVGEHTAFEGHGTLHGAFNSGVRAGHQILDRYCEKKLEEEEKRLRRKKRKRAENGAEERWK